MREEKIETSIGFCMPVTVSQFQTEELEMYLMGLEHVREKIEFTEAKIRDELQRREVESSERDDIRGVPRK